MKKLLYFLKDYKKECVCAPLFKMLEASFELFVPLVIAAIIDKLQENVTPTTIPDDIDDFEALNSDVFDAGMAELLEAIPAGGGGGGGDWTPPAM